MILKISLEMKECDINIIEKLQQCLRSHSVSQVNINTLQVKILPPE